MYNYIKGISLTKIKNLYIHLSQLKHGTCSTIINSLKARS